MKRMNKVLFPILTLLCMLFILSNSLSDSTGAEGKRGAVVEVIERVAETFCGEKVTLSQKGNNMISKLFHIFEFCLFSLFLSLSVLLRKNETEGAYQKVLLCGVFLALADEQLQMLSSGRGSRLSDVFVDLAGVMIGFFLAKIITKIVRRKKDAGDGSCA